MLTIKRVRVLRNTVFNLSTISVERKPSRVYSSPLTSALAPKTKVRHQVVPSEEHLDWVCSSCGGVNGSYRRVCLKCATPSSVPRRLPSTYSPPSSASTSPMQTERSIILHQKGLLKEEKEPRRLRSDGAPLIKDIIRDCEAQGEYSRGVEVALHRIQNERTLKPAVVANMIRLLGKAGEAGTALDLFHGIGKAANMSRMKKDAFHYNAILSCLAKSNAENKLAEAIKIFEDMRQQKVRPNKFIFNTLIHIYIKEGKYGGAIRLFEEMSAEGIKADEAIYNSVITACNQEGLLVRAAGLFKVMERERYLQPAEHTYGAALSTAAKNRDANSAIELLNKAKKVKHIALNQVMYTNAMLACASDQHWEKGIALYEEMVSSTDLIPDRAVYVALLGCLANGRQGIRAQEILALLSSKNFACQANVYSLVLEAMDSDEPIEDAHLKQMVRIFNEAVASGALQPLKIVGKRVDARAYQISGAVRKIALVQLFRTLNTAVLPEKLVETGLMVIVGTSTTARDCCLHAINHLIRPTGFLSYKMLYNDTMIVVEGKSIDKWRSTRRMFNALHKHEQAPSNTLVEDGLSPAILRM